MGALLTDIARGPIPVPQASPLDIQTKQAALANQRADAVLRQQQAEDQRQQFEQRAREQASQEDLMKAYQAAGGDPDKTIQLASQQGSRVLPAHISSFNEALTKAAGEKQKLSDEALTHHEHQSDLLNGHLSALAALPDEQSRAAHWDGLIQQSLNEGAITQKQLDSGEIPRVYPGADAVNQLKLGHTTDSVLLAREKDRREAEKAAADLTKTKQETAQAAELQPGKVAEQGATLANMQATTAKTNQDVETAQLQKNAAWLSGAARQGPGALAAALGNLPPDQQKAFQGLTKPEDILKVGMKPAEIATEDREIQKALAEQDWKKFQTKIDTGKLNVEQAKLALSNNEFKAKYGTPQSRSQFTQAVLNNPDSYAALPPDIKLGVATDLASQGLSVPTPLPANLKDRAVSADLTMAAINRVRQMLQDPDIRTNGPVLGRLGNVEQKVGDTFFGEGDARAAKEQQLRTDMAYLKMQEAKGLLGGRPASQLIESLSNVTANPKMATPLIEGSLNAMESNMRTIKDEARNYSFGGAAGGGKQPERPGTAASTSPTTPAIPTAVRDALSSLGPGVHHLSDGSAWKKDKDGTITPITKQ